MTSQLLARVYCLIIYIMVFYGGGTFLSSLDMRPSPHPLEWRHTMGARVGVL